MRRLMGAVLGGSLLVAMSAASALADKPVRGCPQTFDPMTISAFRTLMNSSAFFNSLPLEGQLLAPEILLGINSPDWLVGASALDRNGDQVLCFKQNPMTKGHLYGWIFNAIDNTSNQ